MERYVYRYAEPNKYKEESLTKIIRRDCDKNEDIKCL